MTEGNYPEPFQDAAQMTAREVLQMASVIAAFIRAYLQHRARTKRERAAADEQEKRALRAQARVERDAVRARWAPGNDRQWVRAASLSDTADVWCAAVQYTDTDSELFERSAVTTVENCEARLRELHPFAMARYDRVRADGLDRMEAIREAAPLFMMAPRAREQGGNLRAAIAAEGLGSTWVDTVHGPGREEFDEHVVGLQAQRASRIAEGLQIRALADGRPLLDTEEQRAALEFVTNLPPALIRMAVHGDNGGVIRKPRGWAEEFPFPIEEVVAVTARAQAPTRTEPAPSTPAVREHPGRQPANRRNNRA
jgi:hypothetical protein